MNITVYSYILHICCLLLATTVILLAVQLKRMKAKALSAASEDSLGTGSDEQLLLDAIEHGLRNDEFKMYLQFVVDNKTKAITSAEALSRWEKESGELVFPGQYIPAMERAGIITKLDYYMFDKACKKLSEWKETEFGELTISCNFTRTTISESDFVTKISEIADRYAFDRKMLIIEITEDSIERNLDIAIKNILWAKELGFSIALDDIGSGYTSLINLCEYPIDIMKIDREILLMASSEKAKKLFLGIISLAHYLNISVVCEGVETEEQNQMVSESDCDFIQGWYYSKGLSEDKAESFAKDYMSKL